MNKYFTFGQVTIYSLVIIILPAIILHHIMGVIDAYVLFLTCILFAISFIVFRLYLHFRYRHLPANCFILPFSDAIELHIDYKCKNVLQLYECILHVLKYAKSNHKNILFEVSESLINKKRLKLTLANGIDISDLPYSQKLYYSLGRKLIFLKISLLKAINMIVKLKHLNRVIFMDKKMLNNTKPKHMYRCLISIDKATNKHIERINDIVKRIEYRYNKKCSTT